MLRLQSLLFPTIYFSSIVNYAHCLVRSTVIVLADLDTGLGAAGVNHLAATDIESHVIDGTAAVGVEYQVAGLQLRQADLGAFCRLASGSTG